MTVGLITGTTGSPHIDGRAAGELNAGIIGSDDYVLQIGDRLACTMQTANKAIIGTGGAVLQGRHVSITAPETVTIQSGTQGQKRSDLICLRYERDPTTSIESARLVAYKGEPTTGTPADPAIDKGSILMLDASHDMPLYRIPLDGITVGAPIPLFSVLTPVGVPRTRNLAARSGVSNGWDWSIKPIRGGLCSFASSRSFENLGGGDAEPIILPYGVTLPQQLIAFESVAATIVGNAAASINGNTVSVRVQRFVAQVQVTVSGTVYFDKEL